MAVCFDQSESEGGVILPLCHGVVTNATVVHNYAIVSKQCFLLITIIFETDKLVRLPKTVKELEFYVIDVMYTERKNWLA